MPEASPKFFIYDTADQLKMHLSKNPRPYWKNTKFLIDNFHLSGRIKRATTNSFCKSKEDFPELHPDTNTSIGEQCNRRLRFVNRITNFSRSENAYFFLYFFLCYRNFKKKTHHKKTSQFPV